MTLIEVLFLAVALAIDASVVSFSQGMLLCGNKWENSFVLAFATGLFQFLMPVGGYFLAESVNRFILPYGGWLTFLIFAALGIRFIAEAFGKGADKALCLDFKCVLMIAVATSIDAFAAGVGLSFKVDNIFIAAALIGIVTFLLAALGYFVGCRFKKFPANRLKIAAGLILIFLALKSL